MKLPRLTTARPRFASTATRSPVAASRAQQIRPAGVAVPGACNPNPCPQTVAQTNAGQTACCPLTVGGITMPICYNPNFNVCIGGVVHPIPVAQAAAAA
ncbi:MAG: hypothetical protein AAF799_25145 [Myxococcota bacterium]